MDWEGCISLSGESGVFPPKQITALQEMLHQPPTDYQLPTSRWTLKGVQQACEWLKGYSLSGIWKVLRACRVHYKRGQQHLHSPDPEYCQKRDLSQACVQEAREQAEVVTLYLDEFSFYRWPSLAPVYAQAGRCQPQAKLTPGFNTRGRLIVALDVVKAKVLYRQRAHIDLPQLVGFMYDIRTAFPHAKQIHVIQDNWHNVHFHLSQVQAAQQLGISLIPLPIYAPWLNPVEKLGRKLRQEIIHMHRQSDDWPLLKLRVCIFLDQFENGSSELLKYVGLSSV
jgi:hypothetical protein